MPYALVTGASKGIGKAIALELAKKKYDLLLIARSHHELEMAKNEISVLYPVQILLLSLDLSLHGCASKVLAYVSENNLQLQILVNNAGYGMWGYFDKLSFEEQYNMMQLNMASLAEMCHTFLPMLKQQPQAYILNVASTAAYQSVPSMAVYGASKSFVVAFTRALRFELKNTSVSVTCLSPGATTSNFTARAGMQAMQALADKFNMPAHTVASMGIKAMFQKRAEIVTGFVNWISVFATRLVPKSVIETAAAGLYLKFLK